ncbi:aldo/keto reductase [Mycobacterium yunnanensis]|uniref:Aldo/keto reductase n=1 Tax=Mycobacterium yunnanensis TaxID=368477 RepID=A0A9X3C2K5_9MYCO|nr:aldo/keto reductase [Mycobacterium yunnanensis]MCV7420487.1 aldo/keto reductase [Mycobacterium yunnanensis]
MEVSEDDERNPADHRHCRVDPKVPLAEQIGEFKALQDEGKIREIRMSQCTPAQLGEARQIADIVSVQSRFNVIDRSARISK